MFEDLLDHKCDIYHLEDESVNVGYGIKAGNTKKPEVTAAVTDVPCHFHIKNNTLKITQKEPYSQIEGDDKLSLPIGTDIRKNDLVRSHETGLYYRAGLPRNIRNHHIIIELQREDGLKGAI